MLNQIDIGPPRRIVEVYADVSCPFAHFSLQRFSEHRRDVGADHVRLRVRAWPLELVNGEPLDAKDVAGEVADLRAQVAGDLFAGFDPAAFPPSTALVLGAATLAYRQGDEVGEAFNLAIRAALFEHGRAIADPDVLAEIAREYGCAVPDHESGLAAIEVDLAEGRRRGVTGSPHFFVDDTPFFCPAVDIERQGDHLRIRIDGAELQRFIDHAFR